MSDIGAEVRIWAVPITVLVVVGVVAWATIGWRAAVLPLLLAVLAAALLAAMNHARVRGWQGQRLDAARRTELMLNGLERKGHRVLSSRDLPGSDTGLGHLVVGPGGVFAVTSARFSRQVPMVARQHDLFHGPRSQRHLLEKASRQADVAARSITEALRQQVPVTPAFVVHGAHVPWKVLAIGGVDVLSGRRLRRYIAGRRRRLSTVEIERITAAAERAFPDNREPARDTSRLAPSR